MYIARIPLFFLTLLTLGDCGKMGEEFGLFAYFGKNSGLLILGGVMDYGKYTVGT